MSLINAIWWSTSGKDTTHGVIIQFRTIILKVPTFMTSASTFDLNLPSSSSSSGGGGGGGGGSYQPENQGDTILPLTYLTPPWIASELTFKDIRYTASPLPGQNYPLWYSPHSIFVQMELFGCDSYDITQSKI